jgi:hypothetical protein
LILLVKNMQNCHSTTRFRTTSLDRNHKLKKKKTHRLNAPPVDKLEITGGVSHQREEPPNPAPLRQDIHPDRHRQHYALPGNRSLINHPKYTHTTTFLQKFLLSLLCSSAPDCPKCIPFLPARYEGAWPDCRTPETTTP